MASTPFPASPTTRRSGSWLMMFATPVLRSAWSSTSSTRARPVVTAGASVCNMDLGRQGRGLPGEHDFCSVPRRGDDRQRRADSIGAFLHARQPEARGGLFARHASPVIGDRQAKAYRLYG